MKALPVIAIFCPLFLFGQSDNKTVSSFLNDPSLSGAHAGISIYDPETDSFLVRYQAEKMFLPSSNTKIFTLFAALKYLGDSIPGFAVLPRDGGTAILGTGDPSFLHPDFNSQRVLDLLAGLPGPLTLLVPEKEDFHSHADGWSSDDMDEEYAPERSRFPIYGNVMRLYGTGRNPRHCPAAGVTLQIKSGTKPDMKRSPHQNHFEAKLPQGNQPVDESSPFIVSHQLIVQLLSDTLKKEIQLRYLDDELFPLKSGRLVYSLPTDSLLIPMMHESDNFLAEQILLMVAQSATGKMTDTAFIQSLLSSDLKGLPHRPRWVDGSGLSRYNLFSPDDMVYMLDRLQKEFGMDRMKKIFPSGGKGTLRKQFISDKPVIYAKTGSMTNNFALSGYLYTKSGKCLIFSLIVNNLIAKTSAFREARQDFLISIRNQY